MVEYRNGYIPSSLLVTFNVGYSAGEGLWKHQLSPATYAKHVALVTLARKNTGRTLTISAGWGAYRPYAAQVYARKIHGNGAADPGTSSHGGFWERKQTLAIDYGNWSYVYGGSRTAFYRDVRAVGLSPGLISVGRGYPDEPWHVVDLDPWAAVPSGGSNESEEDDMTPDERKMLLDTFNKVTAIADYLGANGGMNTKTPDTIGAKVDGIAKMSQESRDYLGAIGGMNTKTPDSLGYKIDALFKRWVKG